jgi:hypothetical protein
MGIVKRGSQIRGGQLGTDSFSEVNSSRPDQRGLHNNAEAVPMQGAHEKPSFRKGGLGGFPPCHNPKLSTTSRPNPTQEGAVG